jgi:hypothetical protein
MSKNKLKKTKFKVSPSKGPLLSASLDFKEHFPHPVKKILCKFDRLRVNKYEKCMLMTFIFCQLFATKASDYKR